MAHTALAQPALPHRRPATSELRPPQGALRPATCDLRLAPCDLRLATCDLRPAPCDLQPATCDLRPATCDVRLATCDLRRFSVVPLVVRAELQAVPELNLVMADLVAQHTARRTVMLGRHGQTPRQVPHPRDDDERHLVFAFAPTDTANLGVGDEHRIRPDAVLIEPAADALAEGRECAEVDAHHQFAKRLAMDDKQLEEDEASRRDAQRQRQAVVGRLGGGPREHGAALAAQELEVVECEPGVGEQKARAEQNQRAGNQIHAPILQNVSRGFRQKRDSGRSSAGIGPRRCRPRRPARARRSGRGAGYDSPGRRRPCRWPASW